MTENLSGSAKWEGAQTTKNYIIDAKEWDHLEIPKSITTWEREVVPAHHNIHHGWAKKSRKVVQGEGNLANQNKSGKD